MRERERERERERVTNYLELPNNPTTRLQENLGFPALHIHLYYIRKDAADSRCSLIRSLNDSYNRVQR
uniref:Uncharacterized protein n=1 Tax=Prevotella sp. GTC17254 TaxID=3236794 RepID=A0AB33J2K7_9BACT